MKKRTPDLRKLARRQRWMLWLILLSIITQLLPLLALPRGDYLQFLVVFISIFKATAYLLIIVGVVLLLTAQGNHILMIIVCGILMFAPCANLLLLILVNMSVTRTLKRAGMHVRLMGVKDEDVEKLINPDLCSGCGYNLTGNISGVCPECGINIVTDSDHTET